MTFPLDTFQDRLRAVVPGGVAVTATTNPKGVSVLWATLADARDLRGAAALIKSLGGRLSTITAFQPKPVEAPPAAATAEGEGAAPLPAADDGTPKALAIDGHVHELAYHFDLDGDTVTLIVLLPGEGAEIDSLTPLFRSANWSERELMEIYAVRINGHPDPRRLFLDESVDAAVLERLIPFSTLVNAASTKSLWEKVLSKKGGQA